MKKNRNNVDKLLTSEDNTKEQKIFNDSFITIEPEPMDVNNEEQEMSNNFLTKQELLGVLNAVPYTYPLPDTIETYKDAVNNAIRLLEKRHFYRHFLFENETKQAVEPVIMKKFMRPLTARQLSCSDTAFAHLLAGRLGGAWHELLDCIENYDESIRDVNAIINTNEYILILSLLKSFQLITKRFSVLLKMQKQT